MHARELVLWAREYERQDGASPAEALLSVLIELFTGEAADDHDLGADALDPDELQRAWERLTRDLTVPEWLLASQALGDGVDVLAANLIEAGRSDLAAELRRVHTPRFDAGARSPDFDPTLLRQPEEPAAPTDGRLWVPHRARRIGA